MPIMTTFIKQLGSFPLKLYDMLEDAECHGFDNIISWVPNGTGFRVHKPDELVERILPLYFNQQTRYKSFQRQLNMYEFKMLRKAAKGSYEEQFKGAIFHPRFVRGLRELCASILRKSIPRNSSFHRSDADCNQQEFLQNCAFLTANSMLRGTTSPSSPHQWQQEYYHDGGLSRMVPRTDVTITEESSPVVVDDAILETERGATRALPLFPPPFVNQAQHDDVDSLASLVIQPNTITRTNRSQEGPRGGMSVSSWYEEHSQCLLDYAKTVSSLARSCCSSSYEDCGYTCSFGLNSNDEKDKKPLSICFMTQEEEWSEDCFENESDTIDVIISTFVHSQQEEDICEILLE